jgi:hypothetical protein
MVKTLQSIINKVPPATINNPVIHKETRTGSETVLQEAQEETFVRITAEVPKTVKIQMKERLFRNPDETERSIILRALKSIGFEIDDKYINDLRKIKNKK